MIQRLKAKPVYPSNIPVDELPDKICKFFIEKINKIQMKFTDGEDVPKQPDAATSGPKLEKFRPVTQEETQKLIIGSPTKSCSLDPIPTFLLKECVLEFTPMLTKIINASLTSATVPSSFKRAVVTPLLKKATLDRDELSSYRPVSNLSFASKLLEKVVAKRLQEHKQQNNLYEAFQSAYRSGHSTETAILRVQNDILRAIDNGEAVFLVLLDLSAAFDTVSHKLLTERLQSDFGVKGDALEWITSYLSNRFQSVSIENRMSSPVQLECGVPQGSVLGPDLFSDYSSPVASIIRSHGISVHCYADDTQLYITFKPGLTEHEALCKLESCIAELRVWMNKNRLKLNDSKTEFIVFGSASILKKVKTKVIQIGEEQITAVTSVRNIGAYMDARLKMEKHLNMVCKSAWFHLFRIGKIRQYLTVDQAKAVIHAYVTSRLDMNNSLMTGMSHTPVSKNCRRSNMQQLGL